MTGLDAVSKWKFKEKLSYYIYLCLNSLINTKSYLADDEIEMTFIITVTGVKTGRIHMPQNRIISGSAGGGGGGGRHGSKLPLPPPQHQNGIFVLLHLLGLCKEDLCQPRSEELLFLLVTILPHP